MMSMDAGVIALYGPVHRFIQGWIRGELGSDDDVWNDGFARRFTGDFTLVSPSGDKLGPGRALPMVRGMQGTNPRFRIIVRDVHVIRSAGGLVVARYTEWQRFARHTDEPENGRACTVVFEDTGEHLQWAWLQETWLPEEVIDGVTFDF